MCFCVYIASDIPLITQEYCEAKPGFYVEYADTQGQAGIFAKLYPGKHYYEAGSHMGCACGLENYSTLPDDSRSESERNQSNQDIVDFHAWLKAQSKHATLRGFCTDWPNEMYAALEAQAIEERPYVPIVDFEEEYWMPEDVVLCIKRIEHARS